MILKGYLFTIYQYKIRGLRFAGSYLQGWLPGIAFNHIYIYGNDKNAY